jgi:hypothetical protein
MIASRQDGELRMAAGRFDRLDQLFDFFERRELIVRRVKQLERKGRQLARPDRDRPDRSE